MASVNSIPVSFGKCNECGLMHPPLKVGEHCPLTSKNNQPAPQQTIQQYQPQQPSNTIIPQNVQITDINKFLVDLRNIILSQIGIKKIKDPQKLFKNIIIELTKVIENHKD